jgi:hypothetical protein
MRTGKISSAAGSLDGGQKGSQEAGGFTDAFDVGIGASAGTKSSECGFVLRNGSQSGKLQLYRLQFTHGAAGNLREVDLSADQRGSESHQSELERRHFERRFEICREKSVAFLRK